MTLTEQPLCTFQSDALALEHLLVASWQGEDVLSRPYSFEIVLASLNPLQDEGAMLGVTAHLTMFDTQGGAHPYHGIVTSVELLDADDLYHYCRVVLEPRMTRLRQQRFSEIWLDKNLPELVRDVLKNADLTREGQGPGNLDTAVFDFELRLREEDVTHTQASFICQYEESSFDFLSRLLEYSGYYYFFEQQIEQEALVICSDRSFQPKALLSVLYRPLNTALNNGLRAVAHTFTRRTVVQSEHIVLRDFSASNAQVALHTTASVAAGSVAADAQRPCASPAFKGRYAVFGEHFGSNDQGNWLALRRAQALGCRHQLFQGSGQVTGLRSGSSLLLTGHIRPAINGAYQVLEVHHNGHQPLPGIDDGNISGDTHMRFLVIPGDVQFRAPLETRKPNVVGVLSAVVDADDSDSPLLNQYGCYKVRFPFIDNEKPSTRGSAWLRMVSLSAGSSHGMHFPLLKGSEVLVSFLGGDPDRPIIVGSVPNSENPNKVNERNATQSGFSTAGGHFLAIDDHPGASHMQMSAPCGNTTFTLGNGEVAGAQLRTNAHMQLTSSSLRHEVPGVYSLSMGTGDPGQAVACGSDSSPGEAKQDPQYPTPPTPNLLSSNWGGAEFFNWAPKVDVKKTLSFTLAVNTASNQTDVSLGISKVSLTAQAATTTAINTSGTNVSLTLSGITYEYKKSMKNLSQNSEEKVLIKRLQSSVTQLQAELYDVKANTYSLTAKESVTLTCGKSTIEMNALGIKVTSSSALILEGDIVIQGNACVNGNLFVSDKTTTKNATVVSTLDADTASVSNLNANETKLSTPYIPPIALEEQARTSALKTEFEALSETVKGLTKSLNGAANLALAPVENFEPSIM